MGEVEFLHFHPGNSLWHRHDPRLKLLEISLWSIMALTAPPYVIGSIALILLILHIISGSRIKRMKKPLIFWLMMAAVIILTAGLSGNAEKITIESRVLPLRGDGLISGSIRAARLLTVLMAGQLLSATTDPADLASAIRKILFFLPAAWSGTLASAISLTLAFIPRLLDEVSTIRDAAFSRGLGSNRSLIRRSVSLGLPMAEAALRQADVTGDALLSRCFSESPTPGEFRLGLTDLLLIFSVVLPPFILLIAL